MKNKNLEIPRYQQTYSFTHSFRMINNNYMKCLKILNDIDVVYTLDTQNLEAEIPLKIVRFKTEEDMNLFRLLMI